MSEASRALPSPSRPSNLIDLGGSLGIAACAIGLAIFLGGCMGFDQAFALSIIPVLFAIAGFVSTIWGGIARHGGTELTSVPVSLFLNLFGVFGGLLELALWQDWPIFYRAPTH